MALCKHTQLNGRFSVQLGAVLNGGMAFLAMPILILLMEEDVCKCGEESRSFL